MISALVFDFDGVIVDTESPAFQSWQELFRAHRRELPLAAYQHVVGRIGDEGIWERLESSVEDRLDQGALLQRRLERKLELTARQGPRPGVIDYLDSALRLGIDLAIASSDSTEWVTGHLRRLGLLDRWRSIHCADGIPERGKPEPTLYVEALDALGIPPEAAIAIEDSPHGVAAAKRAGLFCVAVPNPVTAGLDLSGADLLVSSLVELPLTDLLGRAVRRP